MSNYGQAASGAVYDAGKVMPAYTNHMQICGILRCLERLDMACVEERKFNRRNGRLVDYHEMRSRRGREKGLTKGRTKGVLSVKISFNNFECVA